MLLLMCIVTIFILVEVIFSIVHAGIGRQPHQICRSPRIGCEARHPHVSHIPLKSRGREHGIVSCLIEFELTRFWGEKWREFEGAVFGRRLRAIGASCVLYILVSLEDLLAAV